MAVVISALKAISHAAARYASAGYLHEVVA